MQFHYFLPLLVTALAAIFPPPAKPIDGSDLTPEEKRKRVEWRCKAGFALFALFAGFYLEWQKAEESELTKQQFATTKHELGKAREEINDVGVRLKQSVDRATALQNSLDVANATLDKMNRWRRPLRGEIDLDTKQQVTLKYLSRASGDLRAVEVTAGDRISWTVKCVGGEQDSCEKPSYFGALSWGAAATNSGVRLEAISGETTVADQGPEFHSRVAFVPARFAGESARPLDLSGCSLKYLIFSSRPNE